MGMRVCKMLFVFFVPMENEITSHAIFSLANFRSSKSLHMTEEDVTVLRQLLSNAALLFRSWAVLPTYCSGMYVISR